MTRKPLYVVALVTLLLCLTGCGGGGGGGGSSSQPLTVGSVTALYSSNGASWNSYVANDGSDRLNASGVACDSATTSPGYYACIHAGEMRAVEVGGRASCSGLSAADTLGAFDWSCVESAGSVRFISVGLKTGKNLSDLLDFVAPGWRQNSIVVSEVGGASAGSAPSVWWANPVIVDNDGGSLNASGAMYLVTADSGGVYTIDNSSVALVVKPGVAINGPGGDFVILVSADTRNFLWIEGVLNVQGNDTGVSWNFVKFSVLKNVTAKNASTTNRSGIRISGSSNNRLEDISASNNGQYGLRLFNCSNNTFTRLKVNGNGYAGVVVENGGNNVFTHVIASNNLNRAVQLNSTSGNSLTDVTAVNNLDGINLSSSSDNTLQGVTIANGGGNFLGVGMQLTNSNNNVITDIVTANNGANGVALVGSSNNTFEHAASNSPEIGFYDFYVYSSSNNRFTGLLKVGGTCYVTGGTNPGLVNTTCTVSGLDGSNNYGAGNVSDAVFSPGIVLASSFAGKVTADDQVNTGDTNGAAMFPATPAGFDWVSFENPYRAWGRDGAAFPDTSNRGSWTSGAGRIWDWSLASSGTVVKGTHLVPSGNDTLTHTWSGGGTTMFLRNAVEITGNGNGLCESGETCLYMPNIGSYQGHGTLVSAGVFIDGAIHGVTLLKYELNGR